MVSGRLSGGLAAFALGSPLSVAWAKDTVVVEQDFMDMIGLILPFAIVIAMVAIVMAMAAGAKGQTGLRRRTPYNKKQDPDRDPFDELFDEDDRRE
ncbi:MAG: hypothetical protein AAGF19_09790 [Pseudomonadota bacterium]